MKQEEYYDRMFMKSVDDSILAWPSEPSRVALRSMRTGTPVSQHSFDFYIDQEFWEWAYDRYLELKQKYSWLKQ